MDARVRDGWNRHRMRPFFVLLSLVPACALGGSEPEDAAEMPRARVVVVDESGAPVPRAEVRGPGRLDRDVSATEAIFSGPLGLVDRFAPLVRADDEAVALVGDPGDEHWVVARDGVRWGATRGMRAPNGDVVVTLRRDEVQRVRCVDTDGRPAVGALVWIWSKEGRQTIEWGDFVRAADGTLDVPHAQHWRALRAEGRDVRIGALVMWGDAMLANDLGDVAFPDDGRALDFVVEPSGLLDVRAVAGARGAATLRWLDAPPDPEDPDEAPEMPIDVGRPSPLSVPLDLRFEVVVDVPGAIDPRVELDGPTTAGQRVEVVVPTPQPAWRCVGRLVDASGAAIGGKHFAAWIGRDGSRVDPEDERLVSGPDGSFDFDFVERPHGTLHFALSPGLRYDPLSGVEGASNARTRLQAQRDLDARAQPAVLDLGDVVCAESPQ